MEKIARAWIDNETGEIFCIYNTDETLNRTQKRAEIARYFLYNIAGGELACYQEIEPD